MSDASQSKRTPIKDRTLIAADDDLIERAKKAMQELKTYPRGKLAQKTELSLSTIDRFFQKKNIQPDSYNGTLANFQPKQIPNSLYER